MPRREILILQHVPSEGAGTALETMTRRAVPHRSLALYAGSKLPEISNAVAGVFVMGGPMNVDEEEKHPFLRAELFFIRELLRLGKPVMGICLGAQLLAKASGSRVSKAVIPEIGWQDVTLRGEARRDPLFSVFSTERLRVLQWHQDTYDLPPGAAHLAESGVVPQQAFRTGERAWGLQFHLEMNRTMLENWFKKSPLRSAILAEYAATRTQLEALIEPFYSRFFSFCGF